MPQIFMHSIIIRACIQHVWHLPTHRVNDTRAYTYRLIFPVGRVFANAPGDLGSIPSRVVPKTLKMVLDSYLLNTEDYKVRIKLKWSNPGKGVAPSHTPRCSSYWKWIFWSPLTTVANFLLMYVFVCICVCFRVILLARFPLTHSRHLFLFITLSKFSMWHPVSVTLYRSINTCLKHLYGRTQEVFAYEFVLASPVNPVMSSFLLLGCFCFQHLFIQCVFLMQPFH